MELTINGRTRRVDVPADMPVLWVLPPLIAPARAAPVAATYRFDQVREAIAKAAQSGGKVLFTSKARSVCKLCE